MSRTAWSRAGSASRVKVEDGEGAKVVEGAGLHSNVVGREGLLLIEDWVRGDVDIGIASGQVGVPQGGDERTQHVGDDDISRLLEDVVGEVGCCE